MTTALVFPGQGSQYAGMGCALMDLPAVAAAVEECAAATELPIMDYVSSTPDAELRETERAQPAIFALSLGLARVLLEAGIRPDLLAGHSAGHFAALAVSGALCPRDAARLVARRGRLMAAAGRRRPGGMGVVRGLDSRMVAEVLDGSGLPLWPANVNLSDQVAVAGARDALDEARRLLTDAGGQWIRLDVSGAFHSPLLDEEAAEFATVVDTLDIGEPSAPILRNRDGAALTRPECIREDLKRHMTGPVRWVSVMETLLDTGVDLVLETGPGRVLTGLMKRHARGFPVLNTGTLRSLRRAVESAVPHGNGGAAEERRRIRAPTPLPSRAARTGAEGYGLMIDDANRQGGPQ